jgi:hypothetical protein
MIAVFQYGRHPEFSKVRDLLDIGEDLKEDLGEHGEALPLYLQCRGMIGSILSARCCAGRLARPHDFHKTIRKYRCWSREHEVR